MTAPRRPRILTLLLAGVLTVTGPVLLSGCAMITDPIEQLIDDVTGGEVDLGGDSVPADFPSDVPLVDGEVEYGGSIGAGEQKAWNVTIRSAEPGLPATIAAQLEEAGFTASLEATLSENTGTLTYGNDGYGVVVLIIGDGDEFVINYSVTRNAPAE